MKQHPANLTEASPYKPLPLQLDVHTIIDLLKKLLHSYRPEEASASVEKLLEAQSQFGVWEDGVSASQGGLDHLLRDPKCLDLRDSFKSNLSVIKSLLTGDFELSDTTPASTSLSTASSSPQRLETYPGEFFERLNSAIEALAALTLSLESARPNPPSSLQSGGAAKRTIGRSQQSSPLTTPPGSIFSHTGVDDNESVSVATSNASCTERSHYARRLRELADDIDIDVGALQDRNYPKQAYKIAADLDCAVAGKLKTDPRVLRVCNDRGRWDATAIVDDGSAVSVMTPFTAHRIHMEDNMVDLDPDEDHTALGFGGITVTFERKLEVSWREVEGVQTFTTTFFIGELPGLDMLLGHDWTKLGYIRYARHVLILDWANRTIVTEAEAAKHATQEREQLQRTVRDSQEASDRRAGKRIAQTDTASVRR